MVACDSRQLPARWKSAEGSKLTYAERIRLSYPLITDAGKLMSRNPVNEVEKVALRKSRRRNLGLARTGISRSRRLGYKVSDINMGDIREEGASMCCTLVHSMC